MSTERMTLDPRAFGLAAGTVTAVLFAICALLMGLVPGSMSMTTDVMMREHQTGLMMGPGTWGGFISMALFTSLVVGLAFWAVAALYNRLLRGVPAVASADLAAHRGA